jgi:hypothetical protein
VIVQCIDNTGYFLRDHEYSLLEHGVLGRFGTTDEASYVDGGLEIGEKYLVMGIVIFKTYQAYLVDHGGFPLFYPCQLFEVIDEKIITDWHFRLVRKDESIYPFIQAFFGYTELCTDKRSYEKLIIEMDEEFRLKYFNRKTEFMRIYNTKY